MNSKFKEIEIKKSPIDWNMAIFSDVIDVNPKRELKKGTEAKFVSMAEIKEFDKRIQRYTIKKFSGGSKFINGDTLMARITPCLENGKTAFVDILNDEEVGSGSTEFIVLSAKKDKTTPHFVYYTAISPEVRKTATKSMTGTSGRQRVENDIFDKITISLPPISEQEAIAGVLKSLDNKIALNRQMNSTLEAIGQAIFKHWFVNFEFPNEEGKPYRSSGGEMVETELGVMPKGWKVVPLSKIAEFTRGFSYKGSEKSKVNGEYAFMTLNSIYEGGGFKREFSYLTSERLKERHMVKEGEIIIANTEQTKTGTLLGFPALVEFPSNYDKTVGVFSHHITKVIPFREEEKHYLYHYLNFYQAKAIKYHTGSVIWALDVNGWANNEKIMLPKKEILITFSRLMNIIFQRRLMNNKESNSLENIRDSLLPKLMSGEIRIKREDKND